MEDSSIVPDIKVVVWKFGGSDVGDQPGALSQLCDELADFSCALTDSFCPIVGVWNSCRPFSPRHHGEMRHRFENVVGGFESCASSRKREVAIVAALMTQALY